MQIILQSRNIITSSVVRNNFIIHRDGLIYFPDFCHFVLGKLREEERDRGEDFRQNMFKVCSELFSG